MTDMLANAAFLIGLTLWLADQDQRWTYALPFERADYGFYRAAQYGLAAELSWPADRGDRIREVPAADLVPELLPAARRGLLGAGVATTEADHLLAVIGARVATGQTGAAWQRATLAAAERSRSRDRALAVMFDRYLSHAATSEPVHTWPTPLGHRARRGPRPHILSGTRHISRVPGRDAPAWTGSSRTSPPSFSARPARLRSPLRLP